MKPARYHPEALAEYDAAIEYYAERDEEVGREFRVAAVAARERIRANPKLYAADEDTECRACPVHGYPYVIHYLERDEDVWIVAVAHAKRRPGYWLGRLRDK